MSARWWTFVMWALVAASALFWGFRLFVTSAPLPPRTPVASAGPLARGDLTRLLGVDAPPPVAAVAPEPAPDARFQLIGVVSPRSAQAAREGLALIAVDGKPAKAYRVGAVVDGQTVLKSVGARAAMLGPRDGAALVALNIAPPPVAATGALPLADGNNGAAAGLGAGAAAVRMPASRHGTPTMPYMSPSQRQIQPPPMPTPVQGPDNLPTR